ncbi:MAG: serine dehydratase subunit alpha family protein [bacterium]|nr:serine dehydratase subunit alpha family protein [bacterium]
MKRQEILDLLYIDLVSTMGCTDVGAVGYAAAKAGSLLKGNLQEIKLHLSDLLYKNSLRVGIPGTYNSGVKKAVLLGYLLKNPEKKLAVFQDAAEKELNELIKLEKDIPFNISYEKKDDPLYIDLTLHSEHSEVRVLMLYSYDNIDSVYVDKKLVYKNKHSISTNKATGSQLPTIDEIYSFISIEDEALDKLIYYAEINYQTSLLELKAKDIELPVITSENIQDGAPFVRKYILNACNLRMKGAAVPVVGVAGSGNLGITDLTAVYILGKMLNAEPKKIKRSLALAILISTYIKRKMTLLTTICGSALAGGSGTSAATVFLADGNLEQIKSAVNMLIAVNAGTLCDGAKQSCAFKLAFSAENGVVVGKMALEGEKFKSENGINKVKVENTIQNIADINNYALETARDKILEII